jgi:DNA-binding transcriptional MocR family regulator
LSVFAWFTAHSAAPWLAGLHTALPCCCHALAQAALHSEKEHFEEIIEALRSEGEQRVAAVSNELQGARQAVNLAHAKRSELEARVTTVEVGAGDGLSQQGRR